MGMIGIKFNRFTDDYVKYPILTFKNYYHIGGTIIHQFITITPHTNVPLSMMWHNNDYVVVDVGQPHDDIDKAIISAKVWAVMHDALLIIKEEEG